MHGVVAALVEEPNVINKATGPDFNCWRDVPSRDISIFEMKWCKNPLYARLGEVHQDPYNLPYPPHIHPPSLHPLPLSCCPVDAEHFQADRQADSGGPPGSSLSGSQSNPDRLMWKRGGDRP